MTAEDTSSTRSTQQIDNLGTLMGPDFDNTTVADWMNNLKGYSNVMRLYVDEIQESDFNPEVSEEVLDEFYIDDWDQKYSSEGDYYTGGERMEKVYNLLTKLTQEGYDTKQEWDDFKESLKDIWTRLPQFYEAHGGEKKIIPPLDYDPEKPFPQYLDNLDTQANS